MSLQRKRERYRSWRPRRPLEGGPECDLAKRHPDLAAGRHHRRGRPGRTVHSCQIGSRHMDTFFQVKVQKASPLMALHFAQTGQQPRIFLELQQ